MFTMILLLALFAPQTGNQAPAPAPAPTQSGDQDNDQPPDSSPFKGDGVSGSGRSCNGYLRIYPRYLNWEVTDFSCHHTAYEAIKESPNEYIYRLKPWSRKCGFRILIVRHPDEWSGWQAVGYTSEADWHKHNIAQELTCQALY